MPYTTSALARRYGRFRRLTPGARVKLTIDDETVYGQVVESFDAEGRRMLRIALEGEDGDVIEAPACDCKRAIGLPPAPPDPTSTPGG